MFTFTLVHFDNQRVKGQGEAKT